MQLMPTSSTNLYMFKILPIIQITFVNTALMLTSLFINIICLFNYTTNSIIKYIFNPLISYFTNNRIKINLFELLIKYNVEVEDIIILITVCTLIIAFILDSQRRELCSQSGKLIEQDILIEDLEKQVSYLCKVEKMREHKDINYTDNTKTIYIEFNNKIKALENKYKKLINEIKKYE